MISYPYLNILPFKGKTGERVEQVTHDKRLKQSKSQTTIND